MLKNLLSLFCLIFLFYSLSSISDKSDKSIGRDHRALDHESVRGKNPRDLDMPIRTNDGRQPTEQELAVIIGIVKDDFLVNDDIIGEADQKNPSIVMDSNGNFVIVWEDYRNDIGDIYCQRFNASGLAQGGNVKVNDDAGAAGQGRPAIAMDGSGNFIVVWVDGRYGVGLYFQRYHASGLVQGGNIKIKDNPGYAGRDHSIAMDENGNFVIVWQVLESVHSGDWNIYYQRYNASGLEQGGNVRVNDYDTGTASQLKPSIAMDAGGKFIIAWQDGRNGNYDIYYQRYDSLGLAQDGNIRANDDEGTAHQWSPSIDMDGSDNFVMVWYDNRNDTGGWDTPDVYYQRYNAAGLAQESNVKSNDNTGTPMLGSPSIAMDRSGNFAIVWQGYLYGSSNPEITGQRYHFDGSLWGANYRIVAHEPNQEKQGTVVVANGSVIIFSWMDNRRSAAWDIYGKIVTWDWEGVTFVEQPLIANQLSVSSYQLLQNYPNPFNPETSISFTLPKDDHTILRIYDVTGKLVKTLMNEYKAAGYYTIKWTGKNEKDEMVPSGLYLYQIVSGKYSSVKKMILVK